MAGNENNENLNVVEYTKENKNDAVILFLLVMVVAGLTMFFSGYFSNLVKEQNAIYLEDETVQTEKYLAKIFESSRVTIDTMAMLCEKNLPLHQFDWHDLKRLEENSLFDSVRFISPNGMAVDSKGTQIDLSDRDYFQKGIKGERGIDVVFESRFTGESMFIVYAPLYHNNEIIGVITGIHSEEWTENLLSRTSFGEEAFSFLSLPTGQVFASSKTNFLGKNILEYYKGVLKISEETYTKVEKVFKNGGKFGFTYNFNGESETAYVMKNKAESWVLTQVFPHTITRRMENRYSSVLVKMQVVCVLIFVFYIIYLTVKEVRTRIALTSITERLIRKTKIDLKDSLSILSNYYYKVLRVNLSDGSFDVIKSIDVDFSEYKNITEWAKFFSESGYIYEDDVSEFLKAFDCPKIMEILETSNENISYRYRKIMNGSPRWVKIEIMKSAEYSNKNPIVLLYVLDINDEVVRELKMESAYSAAEKANRAKSEFLSNMSHEIRTPMNAIVGMTAIAFLHLDDKDYLTDCLQKITVSSNHLMDLINQVLDMSKIESGKIDLVPIEFSLPRMIENTLVLVKPLIDGKKHEFNVSVGNIEHENLIGDEKRLQQVIINFLSNAVKYTPENGKISISVTEKQSAKSGMAFYEFIIEDNGIGMTKEFQTHIFDPFTRADDERVSNVQGTGLGMSITRTIIQKMGGDIKVFSKIDEGTKFVFTIFMEIQRGEKKLEDETDHIALEGFTSSDFSGNRVLLVDDIELNQEVTSTILETAKLEVEIASNGKEALEKIKSCADGYYDMIFMDVQMPVMDGYEATIEIRKLEREYTKNVPIIAMTANAFSEDVQDAMKAGMNGHISKPFEFNRLLNTLRKYLKPKQNAEN